MNAANLDSETVERLAALGYIGSAVTTKSNKSSHELIDPKDRLAVHEAIQKAGELSNNDRHAEAAEVLEKSCEKIRKIRKQNYFLQEVMLS